MSKRSLEVRLFWAIAALMTPFVACGIGRGAAAPAAAPPLPPYMCAAGGPKVGRNRVAPPGWFHVVRLDDSTYAISEPEYWQRNIEYLLLGARRALLFDTGPGIYGIRATICSLTSLPLTVIPSHLHFDHVGNLNQFKDVRLLDTPALRAQVIHGVFTEGPSQYMLRHSFRFRVSGWVRDGAEIDLGGRTVRLVATPGHTPDSVSVIDEPARKRIFTGDLIGRLTLVNVPGSDVGALSASLRKLLMLVPSGTRAYEAHFDKTIEYSQLVKLAAGTAEVAAGRGTWRRGCLGGIPTRQYDVNGFILLLPARSGALMQPLRTATERLDWLGGNCAK